MNLPLNLRLTIAADAITCVEQTSGRNTGKGEGEGFYLRMPEQTLSAIKIKAAKENTTARMLVLSALQSAGYPVPDFELIDRRRK
jgi:hypothetical protein